MQRIEIIGNLGADAVIQSHNGAQFATFRVGCTEVVKQGGERIDRTQWYNCTFNNVNSGVLPFLKKGKKVFVGGRPRYTIYDSATYRQKMIDVSIFVDQIELLSPKEDAQQQSQTESQQAAPFERDDTDPDKAEAF